MRLLRRASLLVALVASAVLLFPNLAGAVAINEVVVNDVGTDNYEFVELCGYPGESLDGMTLVVIEGETGPGIVDVAISLTGYSISASGLFVIGDAATNPNLLKTVTFENGGETILLVSGFTGAVGADVDADNNCVAEVNIGTIVDGVGITGAVADCVYYGVPAIGPDGTYDPSGVARCIDCTGPWGMICLNGTEPPPAGTACSLTTYIEEFASPGDLNCPPVPTESKTWGSIKSLYR